MQICLKLKLGSANHLLTVSFHISLNLGEFRLAAIFVVFQSDRHNSLLNDRVKSFLKYSGHQMMSTSAQLIDPKLKWRVFINKINKERNALFKKLAIMLVFFRTRFSSYLYLPLL